MRMRSSALRKMNLSDKKGDKKWQTGLKRGHKFAGHGIRGKGTIEKGKNG